MAQQHRDVVVVGASAGGISAISRLTAELPPDLPATVMVVLHVAPRPAPRLHLVLCGKGKLACVSATNGERVERGRVYVAPPDRHLRMVREGQDLRVQVDRGPRENRSRPSIDVLFRSAAAACGPRVIGVLLTGYLDDGVAGLAAVQRAGGRIVVQDPADAEAPELPRRALELLKVDRRLPMAEMAGGIRELVRERIDLERAPWPDDLIQEAALSARAGQLWAPGQMGEPASASCPHCGGPLDVIRSGAAEEHYRCLIGHTFTPHALLDEQDAEFERALHYALRVVEERARFLRRLGDGSFTMPPGRYREEAEDAEAQADKLRSILLARGQTES